MLVGAGDEGERITEGAGNLVRKQVHSGRRGEKTTEHISQRAHDREARGREGGYCETAKRAPRKRRQEEGRHEFRVAHIAKAGRRMMERLAELPRGDG